MKDHVTSSLIDTLEVNTKEKVVLSAETKRSNMSAICLRHMPSNSSCTIRKVCAEGEVGQRIRELGLIPGVLLYVIGRAPLRDPVAIRVRDYTLTLRNSEADHIYVDLIEADIQEKNCG